MNNILVDNFTSDFYFSYAPPLPHVTIMDYNLRWTGGLLASIPDLMPYITVIFGISLASIFLIGVLKSIIKFAL